MSSTNTNDPLRTTDHVPNAAPPAPELTTDPSPASSLADKVTATYLPGQAAKPAGTEPAPGSGSVSIPGYEIESVLGRGGMGVVYKARQLRLERIVALKMILAGAHADADDLKCFRTEAEAIARLQHSGIVQIHEIGEHAGLPYFSMEYCAGGSLGRKLAGTPMPPREAAVLAEQLARAMHAAHEAHVVHRDLKVLREKSNLELLQ